MSNLLLAAQTRRAIQSRTATLSADQASVDAYAIIPETQINCEDHNNFSYFCEESGAANGVTFRAYGRMKSATGTWTPWGAFGTETAVAAGAGAQVTEDVAAFDEVAVFVKSTVGGDHGAVDVIGKSWASLS